MAIQNGGGYSLGYGFCLGNLGDNKGEWGCDFQGKTRTISQTYLTIESAPPRAALGRTFNSRYQSVTPHLVTTYHPA